MVLVVKNPTANAEDTGDVGSIPGSGRSLEEDMQPTSVFLPGESHGQRSLVGYSPWGCKELDMTEHTRTGLTFLAPESDEREMPYACCLVLHLGGTCINALPADLLV